MTRSRRKFVAWIGLGVLLFLQLAVAAYACTALAGAGLDAPVSVMSMSAHKPCEQPIEQRSKLCEQHCLQASQSVDTQPQGVPTTPVLPLIAVADQSGSHHPVKRDFQRAATLVDLPPLVRFGVLRI